MKPEFGPYSKNHLTLSYDRSAGKHILFSGRNLNGTILEDTWAYDYQSNSWEFRNPSISAPGKQYSDMTFISSINKTAVFGGMGSKLLDTNDFWVYDYTANAWEEVIANNPPPAREFHAITYASNVDKMVVAGGSISGDDFDDSWTFDFNTMEWSEIGKLPATTATHSLVYYPKTSSVLLFTGRWNYNIYELDLIAGLWKTLEVVNQPGHLKSFLDIVYDPVIDKFVLFGGYYDNISYDETWLFDYDTLTWYFAETVDKPAKRHTDSNMEYDYNNNVTILVGGSDESHYYGDTWSLSISPDLNISTMPIVNPNIPTPASTSSSESTVDESPNMLFSSTIMIIGILISFKKKNFQI